MFITIDPRLFLSTIKFSSTSEKFKLWSVAFQVLNSCKDDRENEPNKQFSKSNSISVNSKNPWSCPSNLCMVKNIRFLRLSQTRCHRNVKIRHDESVISPAILLQGNRTRHYFYSMVTLIGVISKNVPVQIL